MSNPTLPCRVLQESFNGGLFFDVAQQIYADPPMGAQPLRVAECYMRMIFLAAGRPTQPPQRIREAIASRRSPEPDGQWGAPPPLTRRNTV